MNKSGNVKRPDPTPEEIAKMKAIFKEEGLARHKETGKRSPKQFIPTIYRIVKK